MPRQGWSQAEQDEADKTAAASRAKYNDGPRNPYAVGLNGFEAERTRYRGLGEAAANRQAYQPDFSAAQADRAKNLQARGQQVEAAGMMRQAAEGNAPSRAAIMGEQVGGQSLDAAMGASAGARGLGAASAQRQGATGMGAMQNGAMGQMAGLRATEMGDAREAYGKGLAGIRSGDYENQGLSQQQAEARAESENFQRRLNQSGQMTYEQAAINATQMELDAKARIAGAQTQENATATAAHDARNDRYMRTAVAAGTAIAAAAGSDERMKKSAHKLSFADAHARRHPDEFGDALADMQPYSYEYKAGYREDEGQDPGEKNVGPMAQDMAKNPITGSAVDRGPDGMLQVDMTKAGKLTLGAVGYLAAKQREQDAEIARLKGVR
jgi:hypothetical protein